MAGRAPINTRPNFDFTNRAKASQVPVDANSVFVGKVVRSDSSGVYVNVSNLSPNKIFGPCQVFAQKPRNGDTVIVGFTEGKRQKMVVLGGENKNFKLVNLDDPTEPQDAATKKYVDDKIAALLAGLVTATGSYALPYSPSSHSH